MIHRVLAVAISLACISLAAPVTAAPYGEPRFYVGARYSEGEPIYIKLKHDNHYRVRTFSETWDIYDESGNLMAQHYWAEDERRMPPHQYRTWVWEQRQACYGSCQNVWEGDPVPPGRYRVVTQVDGIETSKWFSVGAYFHIGFEGRPAADFTVFSNKADIVAQMRTELERPRDERQIVAGIVRTRKPGYNDPWRFVLDPNTVFLGEVFVEVCDGSPYYVDRHRSEWRGQQWCPWSSYVASEGL